MSNETIYSGSNLWEDPLKNEPPGLLLSDQIAYYAKNCDMISPYRVEDLRPSYYTLHVGDEYWVGREQFKIKSGERMTIPKNGFVYIRVKEIFNIPFYIVARYSLCVKQVYRGLMLDNGLQIDPGYRGNINVPVYNFTDDEKHFKSGDPLLAMEFSRTTQFNLQDINLEGKSLDDIYEKIFKGIEGYPLKTFKKIKGDRPVSSYFEPSEDNRSSVLALRGQVDNFKNDTTKDINLYKADVSQKVSRTKTIGIFSLLGVIITLFAIIMVHFYWQEGKFSSLNSKYENIKDGLVEKILTQVEENRIKQFESTKNNILVINKSLEDISSRQDISQESIKAIQDTLLKFENLFNQMESESSKSSEGLKSKSIELDTFSLDVENIQGKI